MLKKFLLIVVGAFVGVYAFAQNTPETATVIDDVSTYEGTDAFVFSKADRKVYAYNNLGAYELFGIYEKVYTLKTEVADGEVDYIQSAAESTRNNFIMTDYIPKTNTRAEGIFEYDSKWFHDWNALFGVGYYKSGWKNLFTYFAQSSYGNGAIQASDECVDIHGSVTWDKKTKFVLDATTATGTQYDMNGKVLSYIEQIEDVNRTWAIYDGRATKVYAPKSEDCVTPIYIFAMNKSVPAYSYIDEETGESVDVPEESIVDCQAPGTKFFGMKIYEGETLVRDFVPYVQDGVPGAFDKVNNTFWPATDYENLTPLKAGSITAYEGKIVRLLDDNHVYKYTDGAWQDCGEISKEEIEDEAYKDMNNWLTNDNHMPIFQDHIMLEDGINYIDDYVGTGNFEPLMTQVEVEKGAEYNLTFNYENASGSWGWSRWTPRAAIWNGYNLSSSDSFAFTGGDVLSSQILGHEQTSEPVPVDLDFTAAMDKETIVIQFGMYEDGVSFMFSFGPFSLSKYVYPETYPEIDPDSFAEIEPTRWDVDGVGYAILDGGEGSSANEGYTRILDNDASTKFCGNLTNAWFVMKAEKPVVVKQYSIVTGGDSYTYRGRNPRGWTLEGSNDQVTWEIIDKVERHELIEDINSEEFTFVPSYVPEEGGDDAGAKESTSTEPFQFFRLTINDSQDGCQISEFWINEQAHEWGDPETVEPTCCLQGKNVYTCADCGAKKTEWIPETNAHTYDENCATDYDVTLVNKSTRENPHHFKAKRVFFDGHDSGMALYDATEEMDPDWTEVDFDDSDWDTLTLPLGTWDTRDKTNTIWSWGDNAYMIRAPFVIDDASKVDDIFFESYHDDSFWVFLNGELILQVADWNTNDFWDTTSTDPSAISIQYPNNARYSEPIPDDLIHDGENVLCVLVEQNWGGAWFDMRLSANGDVSTGVKEVETAKTGAKDVIYDLQGRMITGKNLPKGIYIVNGKKQVVK